MKILPRASGLILVAALFLSTLTCMRQSSLPAPETTPPVENIPSQPINSPTEAEPTYTDSITPTQPGATSAPLNAPLGKPQYRLDATLVYAQHHLSVTEIITYTNQTNTNLGDLVLIVEPNRYQGVFLLNSMTWLDGQEVRGYNLSENQLRLTLRQPLTPGKHLTLNISYELSLPSPVPAPFTRPVPFGYTSRQTNLVDWYPFIPPYDPEKGWLAHQPGYFGEHLVYETSDFYVNIRIADAPPPISNHPSSASETPPVTSLILAASATPEIDGEWYHFIFMNARNFAWSVSHDYVVKSKTVGDITVNSYAFPLHAAGGEAALETTSNAMSLFSDIFSPYQHTTLSVVEADFLDGMEYDGLYFLSNGFYNLYSGKPADYLTAIAAHETAHQWFYALVGNDQAMEPWLDEALCTYGERLYYERFSPEALEWWWDYRINYYEPKSWVNGSIYSYSYTPDAYRAYRDAVYLNGAIFLEELRKLAGDQTFFSFLKDYVKQTTYTLSTTDQFFSILNAYTKADLTPLHERFFNNR